METVLLIHDAGPLRDALQGALSEAGFEALAAGHDASAIEMLKRRRPALVLVHELCGWTCDELSEVVRHLDPGSRVVVFTSSADPEEMERQARLGILCLSASDVACAARDLLECSHATRILVVDDEPSVCQALQRVLRERGYEVETASDGQEALDLFRRVGPRLVLLDVKMPGIDGLETLRRMRELDRRPGIIMIAGDGSRETMRTCRNLGALDFFQKPLDFDRLDSSIRSAACRMAP